MKIRCRTTLVARRLITCTNDVERFEREGWEPLPAMDGTHHGEYACLMRKGT